VDDMRAPTTDVAWPELTLAGWEPTRDALHLWTQVVGKVRLALEPSINHWWQIPLYVSARGLTTSLMHADTVGLEVEFDLLADEVAVRTTSGERRSIALEPRSVASFHAELTDALAGLGIRPTTLARPVEVPVAIPFPEDTDVRAYDADAARRFWRALLQGDRLFRRFRAGFVGKASPVHFFWGAFDLATTRFSGREAPLHPGGAPNCADWVMHEAYSHEVSSCGFWPGGSDEGSFYSYAYPQPDGFADRDPGPGAYWDGDIGEFILPYRTVRQAADPDALVLSFLQSTYEAAADLAGWDRAALERPVPPSGGSPAPGG
jgi:Family of unknown function (DUF5996)